MERIVDQPGRHRPPLIIELIGPAGAGKTTLSRALKRRSERIQIGAEIELRKIKYVPVFVRNALLLLPIILYRWHYSRWFTWDEIKAMVYLRAWPRVVRRQASNDGTLILLDHGPVFKLAKLNAFGPEKLKSQGFEHWWHSMFERWAFTLDIVIWLDAPDKILLERINARNKRHAVKGKSEREAYEFLIRYRTSYEQILAKLTAYGRPTLFPFDTSQASIEQTADEVLAACDLKRSERLSLASHDFTIR